MIYAWTLTLTQKPWNVSMEQKEAAPIGSSSYGCDVHIRKESLRAKFQFYGAVEDGKCHKDKPLVGTVLQHQFNAGSINVRTATCDAKCEEVIAREADRANLTICGLQETRRLKKGEVILNIPGKKSQYIFHWSGFERKREYGVGLLIRKSPFIQAENVNYHGPRHISASIVIKGCKVFVISAYAPTETATASAKSAFYCELNKIIKSRP